MNVPRRDERRGNSLIAIDDPSFAEHGVEVRITHALIRASLWRFRPGSLGECVEA